MIAIDRYVFTENKGMIYQFTFERFPIAVMLNEVKHLYNTDSSLKLRMTGSVNMYVVTKNNYGVSEWAKVIFM